MAVQQIRRLSRAALLRRSFTFGEVSEGSARPALVALILFLVGIAVYPQFHTIFNLDTIVSTTAPTALLAVGVTFVLLAGEIDLSVGSTMSLTSVMLATWMGGRDGRILPTVLLTLLVCAGIGLLNGVLVVLLRIPSFIVTLAMLFIIAGVNLLWTNGSPRSDLAPSFAQIALAGTGIFTTGLALILAVALAAAMLLKRTVTGRSLYLIGSNRSAATNIGLPVRRAVIAAFVLSSLCAGLAGAYETSYVGSGQSYLGQGMELTAIAAAVIGAVSLFGGKGSTWGATFGALVLGLLFDLLLLAGASSELQPVVTGGALIVGATVYGQEGAPHVPNWLRRTRGMLMLVPRGREARQSADQPRPPAPTSGQSRKHSPESTPEMANTKQQTGR